MLEAHLSLFADDSDSGVGSTPPPPQGLPLEAQSVFELPAAARGASCDPTAESAGGGSTTDTDDMNRGAVASTRQPAGVRNSLKACRNALNPYHECSAFCVTHLAEEQERDPGAVQARTAAAEQLEAQQPTPVYRPYFPPSANHLDTSPLWANGAAGAAAACAEELRQLQALHAASKSGVGEELKRQGKRLFAEGHVAKARAVFGKAWATDPTSWALLSNRAACCLSLQLLPEAVRDWTLAISLLSPVNPVLASSVNPHAAELAKLLAKRAAAYHAKGELDRARLDLRTALAQEAPDQKDNAGEGPASALRAELLVSLARVDEQIKLATLKSNAQRLYEKQEFAKAASTLTRAIQLAGDAQSGQADVLLLGGLLSARACSSLAQGLCARCIEDCERVLAMLPLAPPDAEAQRKARDIRKLSLLRRGTARAWVGHLADAREDMRAAAVLEVNAEERARIEADANMLLALQRDGKLNAWH